METNFFQKLTDINPAPNVEWVIAVKQIDGGNAVVSVLYKDATCGDKAAKVIPPLTFNATPQQLDECFFADITTAMGGTVELLNSMAQYLKQQEKAKLASQQEKDKKASAEKGKTEKLSKYEEALKKAAELEAEGKYKDAWMKVPSPQDYPQHAEALRARKAELSAKFESDLFSPPKA